MPALTETHRIADSSSYPNDVATQLPSFSKRRVWVAPTVKTHSAIVLGANKLTLIPGSAAPQNDLIQAITQGTDPADVFGPLVTVVNLSSVRSITHEMLENRIDLDSHVGGREASPWTSRTSVTFADSESADVLFAKLWRRLGDEYKLRPDRPPTSHAVQAPLAILAGILVATGLVSAACNAAADLGSAVPAYLKPFAAIDWRWIATLGGIAAACVQVWLYRILTRPPIRLELIKTTSM